MLQTSESVEWSSNSGEMMCDSGLEHVTGNRVVTAASMCHIGGRMVQGDYIVAAIIFEWSSNPNEVK